MKLNLRDIVLISLFAALIAVGGFIKIPMPGVPFTLQFLFVNLAMLLLGSKRGALAVLVYVVVGLCGLPVFTQGGGIGYVLQPSFGYLIGFVAGAFFGGMLLERMKKSTLGTRLAASALNLVIVYTIGVIYLHLIRNIYLGSEMSAWNALLFGALVFLPGDGASGVLGAFLAKRLKPLLDRGQA